MFLPAKSGAEIGLDHPRSGELVVLSRARRLVRLPVLARRPPRPDFARTVDIHRKPGYDPCELFFDPKLCVAQRPRDAPAASEEARVPHALRRDPA